MKKTVMIFLFLVSSPAFALSGDFDHTGCVNLKDIDIFADNWLCSSPSIPDPNTDLNLDGTVNFLDFALMGNNWLICLPGYGTCETEPDKATIGGPVNHSNNVLLTQILTWSVVDCNDEQTLNDIWFGVTGAMTKVSSSSSSHSYAPVLELSHAYQWRIDTVNNHGKTTGDVWDFNTIPQDTPVAESNSVSVYTYIVKPMILVATDDGLPNPPAKLSYYITALPANGYLRDANGFIVGVSNLPYALRSNKVCYETSIIGATHLRFKAFDGEYYSDENQVDINTVANPKDCLSFDGIGYVTVPDDNATEFSEDGNTIAFFIKTFYSSGGILKKHETGTAGYGVDIVDGYLTAKLYEPNGSFVTITADAHRVDDGQWYRCSFSYDVALGGGIYIVNEDTGNFLDTAIVPVPNVSYVNDCNLVIGKSDANSYKGELDNVRFYSGSSITGALAVMQNRSIAGNSDGLIPSAKVRFKCDLSDPNNTNARIYDDISSSHLIGTFSDSLRVRYYPYFMCPCSLAQ